MVGVKTTCKDRWRQVLAEGTRIETKHILTLQRDISENQLTSMRDHKVQLVVPMHPKERHLKAPEKRFYSVPGMEIWTLERFVAQVREALTK